MKEDRIFKGILWGGGILISLLLFFIFIFLFKESLPSIKSFGFKFFFSSVWDPVLEEFGMLPFLIGTLLTSILALFVSSFFSISIALLLGFYYKKGFFSNFINYTTDLLAGIPSVIYGFWGLFFLVPIISEIEIKIKAPPYGVGILTASIVLSIMIIPYASSISREVIKLVPDDLIEAGFSMGATTYEVIKKVIIPYAKSGIFAGLLLSFGRAFGETMAVTMVIGNSNYIPKTLFDPANTMASVIANEFTEAVSDLHLSSLIHIALWLFIITFIFNVLGNFIIKKLKVE